MPEKNRITLCLSSQVGCRQACTFCHTGRMGLIRQLAVEEIVGQLVMANRWLRQHPEWLQAQRLAPRTRITNVVFMTSSRGGWKHNLGGNLYHSFLLRTAQTGAFRAAPVCREVYSHIFLEHLNPFFVAFAVFID